MDMIRHQVAFYDFRPFIRTELLQYIPQVLLVLIVNDFSSILRCEDNVILAHPFRVS